MNRYRKPWRLFFSIFKETFPFIIISFFILTTLVFVQQVGKYSNIILSFEASSQITLRFLISLIPGIIIITLPVSLLLGTVFACSRLSSDSELIAAQSLGISKLSLALPFVFFGILGTALTFYLSSDVAPRSLRQLKSLRAKILLEETNTRIRPHVFITSFPNVLLFVQDVDTGTGDWRGVFILQNDQARGVSRLLTSERGQLRITSAPRIALEADLYQGLSLENRVDTPQNAPQNTTAFQAASVFEKLSIKLTEKNAENEETGDESGAISEMTMRQLATFAGSAESPRDRLRARVEWHKRFAFPFACLTLTCVTFIVAIRGRRFSTRPRTVVAILFIAMAFYLLLVAGQNVAQSGKVPVWLGVWFSNLMLLAFILKSFISNKRIMSFSIPSSLSRFSLSPRATRVMEMEADRLKEVSLGRAAPFRVSLVNLINYLLVSEIAKYYLLALTALVATSLIFTLFDLIPAMAKSGATIGYAASYLGYLAPQLTYYVSPFALLVAILTGFSVLARTNQLVILAGVGQSKARIVLAILFTAFALGTGLWLLSDYLLPLTNREQDVRYHKIKSKQMEQTTLAFGKKWVYGKNNIIYSYQRIDADNTLLNTAMYYLSPSRGVLEKATYFGKAAQISAYAWRAMDGWMDIIRPEPTIEKIPLQSNLDPIRIEDGPGLFRRSVNESSKMAAEDLGEYIHQLKAIGISTTDLQLDLKKRVAFPFSCLTLALLAVPFATTRQARRSSPLLSIAFGVGISLVFWLLMTLFEAAGKQSNLPVSMAVWAPQILFLALGLYLNLKHRTY